MLSIPEKPVVLSVLILNIVMLSVEVMEMSAAFKHSSLFTQNHKNIVVDVEYV